MMMDPGTYCKPFSAVAPSNCLPTFTPETVTFESAKHSKQSPVTAGTFPMAAVTEEGGSPTTG